MTTVRERGLSVLAAALKSMAEDRSYGFERNRVDDVAPQDMPLLVLMDGGQELIEGDTGGARYIARFAVEAYCTAASGALIGAEASAVYGSVVKAVRPDAEGLLLDDYALDVREVDMTEPEFGRTAGSGRFASFEVSFEFEFETAEFDPETVS